MSLPAQPSCESDADVDYASDASEDLSDEQIQHLLMEAETRLRAKASRTQDLVPRLPRLDAGNAPQPYIKHDGKVAELQPGRLPNSRMEEFVRRPRKIEDPVVLKQRKAEVGSIILQSCL